MKQTRLHTRIMQLLVATTLIVLLASCDKEGSIRIKNNISNVQIESVNFSDYAVPGSLITGQTGPFRDIMDHRNNWPKIGYLTFYMTRGEDRIFLQTLETYVLEEDQQLTVELTEDTPVFVPR